MNIRQEVRVVLSKGQIELMRQLREMGSNHFQDQQINIQTTAMMFNFSKQNTGQNEVNS